MYRTKRRQSKDAVKVLENGSSVADHAESHVQWILLGWVGITFSERTCGFDVRFWRTSQGARWTTILLRPEKRPAFRVTIHRRDGAAWKKVKKDIFSSIRYIPAFRRQRMSLGMFRCDHILYIVATNCKQWKIFIGKLYPMRTLAFIAQ